MECSAGNFEHKKTLESAYIFIFSSIRSLLHSSLVFHQTDSGGGGNSHAPLCQFNMIITFKTRAALNTHKNIHSRSFLIKEALK